MPKKKYRVDLSVEERTTLEQLLRVGAREHQAPYLGMGQISAHAWCEWGEVRTCEPPHSA